MKLDSGRKACTLIGKDIIFFRMMTKENETSGITKEAIKNNSDSTCIFKTITKH